MQRFLECCAGIDVGKREITVTILEGPPDREPEKETRTFGTTVPALEQCRAWLVERNCQTAVLESTGSYWFRSGMYYSKRLLSSSRIQST